MNVYYTKELTNHIYLDSLAIRKEVFINEQQIPATIEIDSKEELAIHFVLYSDEKKALATCRLLPLTPHTVKLQRVAVKKAFRGKNYGKILIAEVEQYAKNNGYTKICLGAQAPAIAFYEQLNYIKEGDMFVEAAIEHYYMTKDL